MNDLRRANTGGLRNEEPLTDERKQQIIEYAMLLGMPADRIFFSDHEFTGYGPEFDVLIIGTDVLPSKKRLRNPNSNISFKGTIAHELVGHREAAINGFVQPTEVLEEAQASIRAARFAPDLSRQERMILLKDAVCRLRNENVEIRYAKTKMRINRR